MIDYSNGKPKIKECPRCKFWTRHVNCPKCGHEVNKPKPFNSIALAITPAQKTAIDYISSKKVIK